MVDSSSSNVSKDSNILDDLDFLIGRYLDANKNKEKVVRNLDKKIEIITSIVTSKRFYSEENNYYTLSARNQESKNFIIRGYGCDIKQNDCISAKGYWDIDEKDRKFFNAEYIEVVKPTKKELILEYLSSGIIKGISKKSAVMIVNSFGLKTFDILDYEPETLLNIKGIGVKVLNTIIKSWDEVRCSEQLISALIDLGYTNLEAIKIFKRFGNNSISQVKSKPYSIHNFIHSISFERVDEVALKIGVLPDSEMRIFATFEHILKSHHYSTCETVANKDFIFYNVKDYLKGVDVEKIEESFQKLIDDEVIHLISIEFDNGFKKDYLQHRVCYSAEEDIAKRLFIISKNNFHNPSGKTIELKDFDFPYTEQQTNAIFNALNNKVAIITGKPGVGKTTVLKEIIKQYLAQGKNVLCAAPTGKAAQRMYESTGLESSTLHRLLEFSPLTGRFTKNRENPIICDVMVIDEFSMVDIFLFSSLLKAISDNTQILLIGDEDQLPSVGCGAVLRDLIKSGKINVSVINKIQRQKEGSDIIKYAFSINDHGLFEYEKKNDFDKSDFFFIDSKENELSINVLKHLIGRMSKKMNVDVKNDIQVLSSVHGGELGTIEINKLMQGIINPKESNSIQRGAYLFKEGDKVIQIKNNYKKDVYNGDCGVILNVVENVSLSVLFNDDKVVDYKVSELDQLLLSYCLSCHKSQGSEYPFLIIMLGENHINLMDRSWIYTGITRGKSKVFVIGSNEVMLDTVSSIRSRLRKSNLIDKIVHVFEENDNIEINSSVEQEINNDWGDDIINLMDIVY